MVSAEVAAVIELPIIFAVLVGVCFALARNPRFNGSPARARARRDAELERWLNQDDDPAPKRRYTVKRRSSKRRSPARR